MKAKFHFPPTRQFLIGTFLLALLTGLPVTEALAGMVRVPGGPCSSNEPGRGGWVDEKGPAFSSYDVWLTDYQGKRIGTTPYAHLQGDAHGNASINVPTGMPRVCDAQNDTTPPVAAGGGAAGGARAVLSLESIFFDPNTGTFYLQNTFETISFLAGDGTVVRIPDLYADTNANGVIGDGDILYSLIDLDASLLAPQPSFTLGDFFDIIDGQVAALPFMWFSTAPFVFDPSTGFTGTPYSGQAIAATEHDMFTVPEPSTLFTLIFGLVAIAGFKRFSGDRKGQA